MSTKTKIRIALADDHTLFRKALAKLIESFGSFEIVADFETGEQLIQACAQLTAPPDIAIIDVNMTGMNGYETTEALLRQFPSVKVLAVSMHDNEFSILKMIRSGAKGYLLKNCSPEELKTALSFIYKKGFYHSELASNRLMLQLQNKRQDALLSITEKEMQFLRYNCSDHSIKEIAEFMKISPRTLDGYKDALFSKLNINSRTGLAIFAAKIGIVPLTD